MLHRHAVDQHAMERAVAGLERRSLRAGQPAKGVVQRVGGQVRVQLGEGVPQPLLQHYLPVVAALCARRIRRDIPPVLHLPPDAGEPVKGDGFNVGFGDGGHGSLSDAHSCAFYNPQLPLGG